MLTRPSFTAPTQHSTQQHSTSYGLPVDGLNTQAHGANRSLQRLSNVRSVSGPHPEHHALNNTTQRRSVSMVDFMPDIDVDIDEARPTKRARFESDAVASPQIALRDALHETIPGDALGLPMRPAQLHKRHGVRRHAGEQAARRADGLTPPAMATKLAAPKLPPVADFSPWHGKHTEDMLNEQVVKNGYTERGPSPNQNESNTARMTIWPVLSQKNNVALHTLSLLYTQVLEKRQVLGRCTAPSSFKPPPRVTVTDTKREAWLRDLANSSVPLRRQSRTIPHGIRGKLLLEQCVTKAVPLQRAVWLAKCVGANELRAFKRKGVSGTAAVQGESKWIRDWTVSVEQFMSDTINASGQQGWRARIEYSVKLVTTIYTEHLLEKDHFLDWIVASFSTASLDQAPSWMILTQLYWRDLVSFSSRGRLLAKALLAHLHAASRNGLTDYDLLKSHLEKQLATMLSTAQECLVLPTVWHTHCHMIKVIARDEKAFDTVDRRNMRLRDPIAKPLEAFCHPTVRLYHALNHVSLDINITELAERCTSMIPDSAELVAALLSWACLRHNSDSARIVLVEQIITTLCLSHLDTDAAILNYLASAPLPSALDINKLCRVITNLVRHDSFSTGRYLKWMITSGAMSTRASTNITARILFQLPQKYLPQHLSNTRLSLLARMQDIDFTAVHSRTVHIKHMIQESLSEASPLSLDSVLAEQPMLASDLADWTEEKLLEASKDNNISLHAFCVYRSIFESCGHFDGLISLLQIAMSSDDLALLASVTDTLIMHTQSLAIMSKLSQLQDRMAERYRILRTQQPLDRTFTKSTLDLFSRLPARMAFVKLLRNDLVIYERLSHSAVCSPASDNLIGMQARDMDTDDDIEAVFASGNTMDESLMQRVLLRVLLRAEKATTATTHPSTCCRWLAHLRTLDPTSFDSLVTQYVQTLLSRPSEHVLPRGVGMLVASDCCDFAQIVDTLKDDMSARSNYAVLALLATVPDHDLGVSNAERYHLRRQQIQFCEDNHAQLQRMLSKAAPALNLVQPPEWLLSLVASLQGPVRGSEPLPQALGALYEGILVMLDEKAFAGSELTTDMIIANADALKAPFCAGWLSSHPTQAQSAKAALMEAALSGTGVWPVLLTVCPVGIIKELHAGALESLLKDSNHTSDEKHLTIFDVTHSLFKQNVEQTVLTTIANRLKAMSKAMSTSTEDPALFRQLKTLLHVALLCTSTSAADSHNQGRAYIVMVLCSVLSLSSVETDTDLASYIIDIVGTLVDQLPKEVIAHMNRSAHNAGLKPWAIASCFGSPPQRDSSWLVLASAVQPGGAPQAKALLKPGMVTSSPQTATRNTSLQQAPTRPTRPGQQNVELKYTPFQLRRWEIMPDSTPVIGENDSSLSLTLFGARKA